MSGIERLLASIRSVRFNGQDWGTSLVLAIIFGFAAVGYYGFSSRNPAHLTTGLLLSGACLLGGVLLGFLFGIPRSLQAEGAAAAVPKGPPSAGANHAEDNEAVRVAYHANTNLEQISDWLTKILVGVGLTQIATVPHVFTKAGIYFGGSLGDPAHGTRIAVVIILFFSITGFLFGYLWTRIFLGGELARADVNAVAARVQAFEKQQDEQAQVDAQAISMTYQYLSSTDGTNFSLDDLNAAIQRASAPVKVQLFYQAKALRQKSWQRHEDKPFLDRVIPIFQALIKSDKEARFHANYGQLGFALKDKREPDYRAAEAMLSKAIEIRGPAAENGWQLYEFNRAICRIKLDDNFRNSTASSPEMQKLIWADISVAREALPRLFEGADIEPDLRRWMELNPRGNN